MQLGCSVERTWRLNAPDCTLTLNSVTHSRKLCVESKLPQEPTVTADPKDPYEFILVDTSAATGAAAPNHHSIASANPTLHALTTQQNKLTVQQAMQAASNKHPPAQKKPALVNRTIKPKEAPKPTQPSPAPTKRRRSGSSPGPGAAGPGNVAIAPNPSTSLSTPISISIPSALSVNLGTMGSLNVNAAALSDRTAAKNNVLCGLDAASLANGQFLSLGGGNSAGVADLQNSVLHHNATHNALPDRKRSKNAKLKTAKNVLSGNSILTCLPSGTFIMDNASQPMITTAAAVMIANAAAPMTSSPSHPSPSPAASPHFHSVSSYFQR